MRKAGKSVTSFSNQTKQEICGGIRKKAERRAFLTGILLGARRFSAEEIVLQTECEALAGLFPQLIRETVPKLRYDTEFRGRSGKQPVWCFTVSGIPETAALCKALDISQAQRSETVGTIPETVFAAVLAGCFVISGSVTDPERGYHLEMVLPDAALAEAIRGRLTALQPTIPMKSTVRKGDTLLYLKQNEQICDALTYIGAPNSSMALAEQQIYRSFRSLTNRRMNCDLANIDKTIAAGSQQVQDIELIRDTIGLEQLPENLQEIAAARLRDPEASLSDLGAQCSPPLSRSGVHHRMQRISEIAKKLTGP